jgi:hypothetical protein
MDVDPFTNGSISTIIEDGMAYYLIRPRSRLFKATKRSDMLDLRPGRLSFFGVHNTDRDYIESYENEYGIIFAFETTRPYKLLALDQPATKETLYARAPENIQRILRRNYGYTMSGRRDSELNSDLTLSQYLCDEGYEGYATNFMQTDTGEFHPEFMICNVDGLRPLGRITDDPRKIANILERGRIDEASRDLKVSRKVRPAKSASRSPQARRIPPLSRSPPGSPGSPASRRPLGSPGSPARNIMSYGSLVARPSSKKLTFDDMDSKNQENITPNLFSSGLFGDDSDDEGKRGGLRKRRSYKKRKTRTNKRKRSTKRRR